MKRDKDMFIIETAKLLEIREFIEWCEQQVGMGELATEIIFGLIEDSDHSFSVNKLKAIISRGASDVGDDDLSRIIRKGLSPVAIMNIYEWICGYNLHLDALEDEMLREI